jgi:hypothetical protein
MATQLKLRLLALLWIAVTNACGVRVEIAERPTPMPTSRPRLVRYADVIRVVASPRIIFRDNIAADALVFMHEGLNSAYILQGRSLLINADYDVTWLGGKGSTGRIMASLYVRREDNAVEQAWSPVGTDTENTLMAYAVPGRNSGLLSIAYEPDMVGQYQLRAEVEVTARSLDRLPLTNPGAAQLDVIVFSRPTQIDTNPEVIRPKLDDLNSAYLLIDWRNWGDGVCALADEYMALVALDGACVEFNRKNYQGAIQKLETLSADNEDLYARVQDQIGYLSVAMGDQLGASKAFAKAAAYWLKADEVLAYSVSSQNEVATRPLDNNTLPQLERLLELSYQMEEHPGRAIAEANYYHRVQDKFGLNDLVAYFSQRNLPQAAVIRDWLTAMNASNGK